MKPSTISEENKQAIRQHLDQQLARLARRDYLAVNRKKDGTLYKKHRQYTLGSDTVDTLEVLRIANQPDWTIDDERQIKAFKLMSLNW